MYTNSVFLLVCTSIIYMISLSILYFSKKRINNIENKVYKYLIITNISCLISHIICYPVTIYSEFLPILLVNFILKLFLFFFIIYINLLLYYFLTLLYDNLKKIKIIFYFLIFLESIILCFLPIKLYADLINKIYYSYGSAVNYIYIITSITISATFVIIFLSKSKIQKKKIIPLAIYTAFGTLSMLAQIKYKDFVIADCVEAFLCFIMYFTIENPDVKMIAQLNEAKAQAEKANNAKSEFLSSMSHEIRTPLNAIVGFSQALSEEDLSDEAREEVKDIISASNTLLEIVNGILDISKIEANKLEIINKEYNFKDIFDELVALTKGRLGEKPLEFKYIYDESIPSVLYGDHIRVKQIILNLLTNSVKYTKEGSITFTVNSVKKDDVIRLIVSVEDTGIGIKEENIGKLFTKFERFDEKNTTIEGTGLGLAITKQLVELMNGKIVVQSIHGKGSKFTVAIDQKIVHGKVIETKTSDEDVVEFDLTGKKVLIVDDNNLNLKVASRLIKNYKCDITTVTSGIECIDKINNKEVFDLILMDDMMPRMSGGETLIRLKKIEGFNIPVVALTANAVTGMKEKYLQQGFDDYLAKPIEKRELNRVLHKFLKED